MRIVVKQELCEGNAECMKAAPAVFRVSEEDQVEVLMQEPPETLRASVELAVRRCPRRALALED